MSLTTEERKLQNTIAWFFGIVFVIMIVLMIVLGH
jgi:t-SNARE complex subunit (syntaxin)